MPVEYEIVELPDGIVEDISLVADNYIYFTNAEKKFRKIRADKFADYVKGLMPVVPTLPAKTYNSGSAELTDAQLNSLYPNAKEGDKVYVKAANKEYEKLNGFWAKKPIDITGVGYVDAEGYDLNLLNS